MSSNIQCVSCLYVITNVSVKSNFNLLLNKNKATFSKKHIKSEKVRSESLFQLHFSV